MFDDRGNIQDIDCSKPLEDLLIYVPAKNEILKIAEGSGDNLLHEDEEEGYVDYLDYTEIECNNGLSEGDGGMLLLNCSACERYEILEDAIPDILDMAFSDSTLDYIVLSPKTKPQKLQCYHYTLDNGCMDEGLIFAKSKDEAIDILHKDPRNIQVDTEKDTDDDCYIAQMSYLGDVEDGTHFYNY
jgi:hypothetical protein